MKAVYLCTVNNDKIKIMELLKKTRSQRGFIQTPILIAIMVGLVVVGGLGYMGVRQYVNSEVQKAKQASEIENLKKENDKFKNRIIDTTTTTTTPQIIERIIEKEVAPKAPTVVVPLTTAPQAIIPNPQNNVCDKLAAEYKTFGQVLLNATMQVTDLNTSLDQMLQVPSNLTGFNFFQYQYDRLSGGKDTYMKKIDRLDQTIQTLSLTTFGTDQPSLFKQTYQKWTDARRNTFDSFLLAAKLVVENFSISQVTAAQQTYNQTFQQDSDSNKQFALSGMSIVNNFNQIYKDTFPKLGCPWVAP